MHKPTRQETVAYIKRFTETYKQYQHDNISQREAKCLEVMFDYMFQPIEAQDLFVGRMLYPPLGLAPEPLGGRGVCFNYDRNAFETLISQAADPNEADSLREVRDFWATENTRYKIRQAFPADVAKTLPHDDVYYQEYGVAFPLYRVVGIFIDYEKLLALGIPGMIDNVKARKAKADKEGDVRAAELADGMLGALGLLSKLLNRYASHVAKQAADCDAPRREELLILHEALGNLATRKPETFYEAAQLAFIYTLVCGSLNYGRLDVYLGDFYNEDLESGRIDEGKALNYLQSLWRLIAARESVFHGRVIIGGLGRRNEENANKLALLCIEATRTVIEIEPQLTLRFYDGQNPALMDAAMESIAQGRTYPMLLNDDVNVKAVENAFELPYEEACEYLPFGCGEYVINHKSFGSPNGIINMLKALEITLRGGYDIESQKEMGLKGPTNFATFEDLLEAYKAQLTHYIEILARQQKIEYEVIANEASFLFMSMLYDDCIERGRAIFDGGIRYLGGTLETYGNVNTANSLVAIKKLVYDESRISLKDLMRALDADFKGHEHIQKMLVSAPKYGNDDSYADSIAIELHDFVCNMTKAQKDKVGLHSYLVVIINNEANTLLGYFTAASPDGRKTGEPMANANNPSGGTDVTGITAMLNSLVKLDPKIHAGAVQNIKLSKAFMAENPKAAKTLLDVYFKTGGTQAMITVLDKKDLENAMANPEKYSHIMVRVGGFSARFVNLSKGVQQEILSRTLYG